MPIGPTADLFDSPDGLRMRVPGGPPGSSSGVVVHRTLRRGSTVFDADGVALVDLGSPPQSGWWLVDRLTVTTDSTAATTARVFVGDAVPSNLVDITPTGNEDIAEYPRGLYVAGSAVVLVRWTGGDPAAAADASAQVAEQRPIDGF